MPEKKLPHLAIAILNFNGKALLESFLPGVMAASYPNKSVWIIDNASTDGSEAWVREHYPTLGFIQNGANLGFAEGYNRGLQTIGADYYLLLNSDVALPENCLEPVIKSMESSPDIAFAQPKLRWLRNPAFFEYAGAAGGLLDTLGYPYCRGRLFDKLEKDEGQYDDTVPVFWASGACMFARAEIFQKLGGFYPFFFMHCEEIDLCWRAQNAGYRMLACGDAAVFHLGAASLEKENPLKTFYNFRNNLVMITRNMPLARLLWVLPIRWLLDGVAALTFLYRGQAPASIAVIRAWMAFGAWILGAQKDKYPGKRGFGKLKGGANYPALLKRYFG